MAIKIHSFLCAMIAYGSVLLKDAILMIYVSDRILKTVPILKSNMKQNKKFVFTPSWPNLLNVNTLVYSLA